MRVGCFFIVIPMLIGSQQALSFTTSVDSKAFNAVGASRLAGLFGGHEEITRQALLLLKNQLSESELKLLQPIEKYIGDLDPKKYGVAGSRTKNLIISGNFATDYPVHALARYSIRLKELWNIRDDLPLHTNPNAQVMHFLRNYSPEGVAAGGMMNNYKVCILGRQMIRTIVIEAVRAWRKGEYDKAMFFIGHATHVLQDSFSSAHTQRDLGENFDVVESCVYGKQQWKILETNGTSSRYCYHKPVDSRDFIWVMSKKAYDFTKSQWQPRGEKTLQCILGTTQSGNNPSFYDDFDPELIDQPIPSTSELRAQCLNHDARMAKYATAKFFYLLLDYLDAVESGRAQEGLKDPSSGEIIDAAGFPVLTQWLHKRFFEGPVGLPFLDRVFPYGVLRCNRESEMNGFTEVITSYPTMFLAQNAISDATKVEIMKGMRNFSCDKVKREIDSWMKRNPLQWINAQAYPPKKAAEDIPYLLLASQIKGYSVKQYLIVKGDLALTQMDRTPDGQTMQMKFSPAFFTHWKGVDQQTHHLRIQLDEKGFVKAFGARVPGPSVKVGDRTYSVFYNFCEY